MKIVTKHGNKVTEYRCECKNCGCEFTCSDEDVIQKHSTLESYIIVKCPECNHTLDSGFDVIEKI